MGVKKSFHGGTENVGKSKINAGRNSSCKINIQADTIASVKSIGGLNDDISSSTVKDITGSLGIGLNNFSQMIINMSGISRIDTAGFQMLLVARKEQKERSRIFNIRRSDCESWKVTDLCLQKIVSEE